LQGLVQLACREDGSLPLVSLPRLFEMCTTATPPPRAASIAAIPTLSSAAATRASSAALAIAASTVATSATATVCLHARSILGVGAPRATRARLRAGLRVRHALA